METARIEKAKSGPLPWRIMVGDTMLRRYQTRTDAAIALAIMSGDKSRAAEGYARAKKQALTRMPEHDAVRFAAYWAADLGLSPADVAAQ